MLVAFKIWSHAHVSSLMSRLGAKRAVHDVSLSWYAHVA
jgi:hypothetical protein